MEFAEYFAARRQSLLRFATVLTADPVLADDLVADSLDRVYERWAQIGALENVHAYVRKTVLNEYLSWRRRAARSRPRADLDALLPPVDDRTAEHAEHLHLLGQLRRLPPRQRACVVLRYYEGLSHAEIADALGTRPTAVRSNLSRALAKLRITLTSEDADPADPAHPADPAEEALR